MKILLEGQSQEIVRSLVMLWRESGKNFTKEEVKTVLV